MCVVNKKQIAFLQALLTEPNIAKATETAGISRSTAYRYLNDPEFKKELSKAKAECIGDTIRYLQGRYTRCAQHLIRIIEKPDTADQVRINAINTVFQNCKNLIDSCEIEERMQQIEDMLQGREENE